MDHKLLAAIKTIICRGGNVYEEMNGASIINYCIRLNLKEDIKIFQDKERNKDRVEKKVLFQVVTSIKINFEFRFVAFASIEKWIVYFLAATRFVWSVGINCTDVLFVTQC